MLNFVICDDNLNILEKLSKILEGIFIKYNYDAQIGLKTDNETDLLNYVNDTTVTPSPPSVKSPGL